MEKFSQENLQCSKVLQNITNQKQQQQQQQHLSPTSCFLMSTQATIRHQRRRFILLQWPHTHVKLCRSINIVQWSRESTHRFHNWKIRANRFLCARLKKKKKEEQMLIRLTLNCTVCIYFSVNPVTLNYGQRSLKQCILVVLKGVYHHTKFQEIR